MNTAALVAKHKKEHPDRYCTQPGCLWKTAILNGTTQTYVLVGDCPRHDGPSRETFRKIQKQVKEISRLQTMLAQGNAFAADMIALREQELAEMLAENGAL